MFRFTSELNNPPGKYSREFWGRSISSRATTESNIPDGNVWSKFPVKSSFCNETSESNTPVGSEVMVFSEISREVKDTRYLNRPCGILVREFADKSKVSKTIIVFSSPSGNVVRTFEDISNDVILYKPENASSETLASPDDLKLSISTLGTPDRNPLSSILSGKSAFIVKVVKLSRPERLSVCTLPGIPPPAISSFVRAVRCSKTSEGRPLWM